MSRALFVGFFLLLLSLEQALHYLPVIALLWIVAGREWLWLNRRVLLSILLFNSAVTLGYLLMTAIRGGSPWEYLLYINLKVYTLTFFVTIFFRRVDVVEFFSFSPTLSYLLTLTLSMIYSYLRTFKNFRLATRARGGHEDFDFLRRVSAFFFEKAMEDSRERALAMRARGFFDD